MGQELRLDLGRGCGPEQIFQGESEVTGIAGLQLGGRQSTQGSAKRKRAGREDRDPRALAWPTARSVVVSFKTNQHYI